MKIEKILLLLIAVQLSVVFTACSFCNGVPKPESLDTVNRIADNVLKQIKEESAVKNISEIFIPKIYAETMPADKADNIYIEKADDSTSVIFQRPENNPENLGKYTVVLSGVSYYQEIKTAAKLPDAKEYEYDGKFFQIRCEPHDFLSNPNDGDIYTTHLSYNIDNKTVFDVYVRTTGNIDTEEKAIAVFKDFECFTVEEYKNG